MTARTSDLTTTTILLYPNLLLDEDIVPLRTQPTVKRRRGLTLQQVFVLPPPVWQIDQHFAVGSLVTLFGPSGVGKSFVALDYYVGK